MDARSVHKRPRFIPRSTRGLFFLVLLFIILPIFVVQAWIYINWYQAQQRMELQHNLEMAQAVRLAFDAYLGDICRQEHALGLVFTSQHRFPATQANSILADTLREYPSVHHFNWITPFGKVFASSAPEQCGRDVGNADYFAAMTRKQEVSTVSTLFRSPPNGEAAFIIARNVCTDSGELLGVVTATVMPERLCGMVLLFHREDEGTISLFDRSGREVYDSAIPTLSWEQRACYMRFPPILHALSGRTVNDTFPWTIDHQVRMTAIVPIANIGWAVAASRPKTVVMRPIFFGIMRYLGLLLLSVTGFAFIAIIVARSVTIPISRFRMHTQAFGSGDYSQRVEVTGTNEFAELAVTFNRMAETIQTQQEELSARNMELQARQEELKSEDRAKNEFLAVLSHELLTPLTSMLGWSQIAQDDNAHTETVRKALVVIERNARRQKRLVDDLLDVSRIIHGKLSLNCGVTNLWRLVEQCVESLTRMAEERGISLLLTPPAGELLVNADPARTMQVLTNLINNALKFSESGGTVTICGHCHGTQAIISIQDTGKGIPPEKLVDIFNPFRQLDRDEATGGLGLGLALVKGIIELQNGGVTAVSSGLGEGSCFTIEMPLASETREVLAGER